MSNLDWQRWDDAWDRAKRGRDRARAHLARAPIYVEPEIEDNDVRRFLHEASLSFGDQAEANMGPHELFDRMRRYFGDQRCLDVAIQIH